MWLIPSSVQSAYALASGCSISDLALDSNTWASAIAPLLTVSGKHTQPASYLRSWKANAWMRRLSGRTLQPSRQASFAAWWIASQQASPANPIPSPASAKAPTMPAGSGRPSPESFVTLVRGSWCSKMSADFFRAEEWRPYSQTWPISGSLRNGQCYQRERWAPRIGGNGSLSSVWPTATAGDSNSSGAAAYSTASGRHSGTTLTDATSREWMTPSVPNGGRAVGADLVANKGRKSDGSKAQVDLMAQASHWPTPCAQDDNKSPEAYRHMREFKLGRKGAAAETISSLQVMVQTQWRTPDVPSAGGVRTHTTSADNGHQTTIAEQAERFSHPAPAIQDGPESSETGPTSRRRLNPQFAAWLMGWPEWWASPAVTSCEPLAMEFARYRRQLQSSLSSIV